jgi:hypothetical protein
VVSISHHSDLSVVAAPRVAEEVAMRPPNLRLKLTAARHLSRIAFVKTISRRRSLSAFR